MLDFKGYFKLGAPVQVRHLVAAFEDRRHVIVSADPSGRPYLVVIDIGNLEHPDADMCDRSAVVAENSKHITNVHTPLPPPAREHDDKPMALAVSRSLTVR